MISPLKVRARLVGLLVLLSVWQARASVLRLMDAMLACTRTAVLVLVRAVGEEQNTPPGLDMRLFIYRVTL